MAGLALTSLLLLSSGTEADDEIDALRHFVIGQYQLIGRAPDADTTYQGTLTISPGPQALKVERYVNGQRRQGVADIETALHGEAKVLRMRYVEGGIEYENTCLLQADLDNYARISCFRYRQDGTTRQPGLEALFIVQE